MKELIILVIVIFVAILYLVDLIMMHAWWITEGRWMDEEDLKLDIWDGIIPFRWMRNKG
jgi:hypothetical protein